MSGIMEYPVAETPLAIIDFETTGLQAGPDRVVEVTVAHVIPGSAPKIVFDTLINPDRPMAATEIHGITDADVADAPKFEDIAGNFAKAISGCVVAAYNVYFDLRFMAYELSRVGVKDSVPHLCLMYMRPMLGLGSRCSLVDACKQHGLDSFEAHSAASDTLAAANLWNIYTDALRSKGVTTFQELARLKAYKFVKSFNYLPLLKAPATLQSRNELKSRAVIGQQDSATKSQEQVIRVPDTAILLHEYWEALKAVLDDLKVTDQEIRYLQKKQKQLD